MSNASGRAINRLCRDLGLSGAAEQGECAAGVAIHFMHYNFVRIHQSLRLTPAMAAGVTAKPWSLTDMVRVIEDWEAERSAKLGERPVG